MAEAVSTTYLIIRADSSQVMNELRKLEVAAAASGTKVESALANKFKSAGTKMTAVGRTMTRNVTLPIAAVGAAATKMAFDYDDAFTKIAAVSNASADEIKQWRGEVLEMAGRTAQAPKELADALFFLASAGLDAADIMPVLEASARASAAGLGETADVAKLTANVLNAYASEGIKAADVTDTLFAAVKEGSADADEFAGAMGRILPTAQKAGIGFDEVAASLATVSNIGLDVNEGVTAMRSLFQALLAPGKQAAQEMENVGISSEQMRRTLQEDGVLAALRMLEEATGGNIDTIRKIVPNIRAMTGAFGLTGQEAQKVDDIFNNVTNSTGALDEGFRKTEESAGHQLRQAMVDLQVALIEVGDVVMPIVTDIAQGVAKMAQAFAGLPDPVKNSILVLLGIAAVTGPVLRVAGAISKMTGAVLAFRAANLASATTALVPGLTNLAASVGLVGSAAARALPHVTLFLGGLRLLSNIKAEGPLDGLSKTIYGQTAAQEAASGPMAEFRERTEAIGAAADKTKAHIAAAGSAFANLSIASSQVGTAIGNALPNVIAIADAHREAADAAHEQKLAELSLIDGFLGVQGATLGAKQATNGLKDARKNLANLEADGKKGTDEYRDAVLAYKQAQLGATQAQVAAKQTIKEYAKELKDSGTSTGQVEARVRKFAEAAGLSKREVDKLIDSVDRYAPKVEGIRDKKTTTFSAPGLAAVSQGVDDLDYKLDNLDTSKTISIGIQTTGNVAALKAAKGYHGLVTEPTLILAGEAGAERVDISPLSDIAMPRHRGATIQAGGSAPSGPMHIRGTLEIPGLGQAIVDGSVAVQSEDVRRMNRHASVRRR